jgi:preprotein translocase SecE subunit
VAAAGGAGAPNPIEHATPDVELADAQLALGQPDLDAAAVPGVTGYQPGLPFEPVEEDEELELEDGAGGGFRRPPGRGALTGGGEPGGGGAVALPQQAGLLARLIAFLQGSWRELQRVQWPDRRQVAQATSVVIGFVIVAGVFLGLCDLAFSHLMNYILK